MNRRIYDVAAYIWPAYTGTEMRTRMFWPDGIGEWQSVKSAEKKYDSHSWPRKPMWGYVDEADPNVMEMEINAAFRHGVNVFIYDWYWYDRRPFLEQCLDEGFLKAQNRKQMKFYLMWANHDAMYLWDKRNSSINEMIWSGQVDFKEFQRIAERIITKYFSQDNYYCIDGKPVFMIYDLKNLIQGLGGALQTCQALTWFRNEAVKKGLPGIHLQLAVWGENVMNASGVDSDRSGNIFEAIKMFEFDSITHYQFVHFTDMDRDYKDILEDVKKQWDKIDQSCSIPYYPHISIGWDNNPRYQEFRPVVTQGNTPEMFYQALEMAGRYLEELHPERKKLITINSWNEWTETSYLEPDDLNGYGYLEAVKKFKKL